MTSILPEKKGPVSPSGWDTLQKASGMIANACRNKSPITIWGHDDLDGIASTAIMMDALKGRTEVNYHIPPKDGVHYGLDVEVIDRLTAGGTGLVITVDGGISNHSEAEYCRDMGIPLIITDHHELPKELPPALAVVNPKMREPGSPYPNLCGASVALYLAAALDGADSEDWLQISSRRLCWASLATVSDRVPLLDDNRMILKAGLKAIPEDPVLARLAGLLGFDLSRGLSPLILQNTFVPLFAASQSQGGRHPMVELLLGTVDGPSVKDLWEKQKEWRRKFARELNEKLALVSGREAMILTLVDPDLQPDMVGPLAGGLRDTFLLPAIVIGRKGGAYVGEARGHLPFDLVEMLAGLKGHFTQYGGHKQAAGFTLRSGALEGFVSAVEHYSSEHRDLILSSRPQKKYDHRFDGLAQLKEKVDGILGNGPYGPGNPWPVCLIGNVRVPLGFRDSRTAWLDELLAAQDQSGLQPEEICAELDVTSKGQVCLSLKNKDQFI